MTKKKKLKIVIINQHIDSAVGGSELQCHIISKSLTQLGHKITYLAIGRNDLVNKHSYECINVTFNTKMLVEKIKNLETDLVYWRYDLNNFLDFAYRLSKLKIPLIFSVSHLNNISVKGLLSKIKLKSNYFKKNIQIVVDVLSSIYNQLGFKFVSGMVFNNPDFINTKSYIGKKQMIFNSNERTRSIYFNSKKYILWVANLKSDKRPELLLELAKKINDKSLEILVVGLIQEKKYSYFKDPNMLPKNLKYLGSKSPKIVNSIINSSLFVIHTCLPEGFPGIFIQSWIHGKGVISLSFDPGKIIEQNEIGFHAKNKFDSFVFEINNLVNDSKSRDLISKKATDFAQKNFNPITNNLKLESFFHNVIKGYKNKFK